MTHPRPETRLDRSASDALVRDRSAGIDRLLEIMARLRDPDTGCPWDIEQTFATIAPTRWKRPSRSPMPSTAAT